MKRKPIKLTVKLTRQGYVMQSWCKATKELSGVIKLPYPKTTPWRDVLSMVEADNPDAVAGFFAGFAPLFRV